MGGQGLSQCGGRGEGGRGIARSLAREGGWAGAKPGGGRGKGSRGIAMQEGGRGEGGRGIAIGGGWVGGGRVAGHSWVLSRRKRPHVPLLNLFLVSKLIHFCNAFSLDNNIMVLLHPLPSFATSLDPVIHLSALEHSLPGPIN